MKTTTVPVSEVRPGDIITNEFGQLATVREISSFSPGICRIDMASDSAITADFFPTEASITLHGRKKI